MCLASMSESAEEEIEDTYLEFTKKWIRAVDRGGLFRISNEVYVLFHEIEKMVRKFLFTSIYNMISKKLLMKLSVTVIIFISTGQ